VVERLLAAGADAALTDRTGQTAGDIARSSGNADLAAQLTVAP